MYLLIYSDGRPPPPGCSVTGVEQLLAALEACGVDNARIEIEGGSEVPILDGSAVGWCWEVERVGLQLASYGDRDKIRKVGRAGAVCARYTHQQWAE